MEQIDAEKINSITVTTADLSRPYEVLGIVYFQTTNRGLFGNSPYRRLSKRYKNEPYSLLLPEVQPSPSKSVDAVAWLSKLDFKGGFEGSVGAKHFDKAFYICMAEIKSRAAKQDANAVVGLRYKCFLDTDQYSCFYMQMYGTAVKYT